MTKIIEVTPYNPKWSELFESERIVLQKALRNNCVAIHHIGSTAVPGLAAKPQIDVIAAVNDLFFQEFLLNDIGYTYKGCFNIPLRRTFTKRMVDRRLNLHIFEENDPEIELNILFRDYLRANSRARNEYEALKCALVTKESSHQKNNSIFTGYTLGKNDFIRKILKQTGFNGLRFVLCTHHTELDAAKYFRQKYFFDTVKVADPYTQTFNHPDHQHLILYQGIEIIGYSHIQLWGGQRAAIRIIVIDEDKRNQNAGSQFLSLSEKWLKSIGVKSIHAKSSTAALTFYMKNGYVAMPFNDPDGDKGFIQDIAMGKILVGVSKACKSL